MRLLGTWITQSDISFSENLSDFSFDWLCIDMEHSTISYEQMKNHIISINSKGKEAFVRDGFELDILKGARKLLSSLS